METYNDTMKYYKYTFLELDVISSNKIKMRLYNMFSSA